MKIILAALSSILLASCAQVQVSDTYLATTAWMPECIYIRPFLVRQDAVSGEHGGIATHAHPLREAAAPLEFANILKEELAKIAPTHVLRPDELAPTGWLIEGEIDQLHGGYAPLRAVAGLLGVGRSKIRIHVKVSDPVTGQILHAFDVAGGSGGTGPFGSIHAPGLGVARPFDMRNAASRIRHELSIDPERFGYRER